MSMRGTSLAFGIFVRSAPWEYLGRAVSSANLASIVQLALLASRMRRMSPIVAGFDAMIDDFVCLLLDTLFGVRVLQYGALGVARSMMKVRRIKRGVRMELRRCGR